MFCKKHQRAGPFNGTSKVPVVSFYSGGHGRCAWFALWLLLAATFSAGGNTTNDFFEEFRSFVTNPPVIRQLIYEYTSGARPLDARKDEKFTEFYLVRMQSNGFLYCQTPGLYDDTRGQPPEAIAAYGHFDNTFWMYEWNLGLSVYVRTAESRESEPTNYLYRECIGVLDRVANVLNLGVPNYGIGALRWEGSSIAYTSSSGVPWAGQLQRDASGVPSEFSLRASPLNETNSYPHRILYTYKNDPKLAVAIPSIIDHSVMLDGKSWFRSSYFKITRLATSDKLLEPEAFSYDAIKRTKPVVYYHTNNTILVLSPQGQLVPVKFHPAPTEPPRPVARWSFASLILFSLLILPAFIGWQLSKKAKAEK
ncbi:MAG TPA: hypothetical protein VGF13_16155 [Verrucomicrobiae bacterium]|jgi:hypothetical protein